jgi:hypothetical protein
MWPKPNNVAAFALDLKSTYEGEHDFWAWLTWLRMMLSSSIHLLANDKISFFYMAE